MAATAEVSATDVVRVEDTASVERSRPHLSPLDRLRAGYVFYIILVWLLVAGAAVAGDHANIPQHIQNQIQDDGQAASLAFDLTVVFLRLRKR